jgi:hypothetical protein
LCRSSAHECLVDPGQQVRRRPDYRCACRSA